MGALEAGNIRAAVTQQVIDVDRDARPRYNKTDNFLAVSAIGNADGRDFDNLWSLQQNAVDLKRGDVDAATDDQILLAPGDMQVAVGVEKADIPRSQSARDCEF